MTATKPVQMITLEEVKVASRKAYDDRRLVAQRRGYGEYGYGGPTTGGRVCAIGSALTPLTIGRITRADAHTHTIREAGNGLDDKLLSCFHINEAERDALRSIQRAHDTWADCPAEERHKVNDPDRQHFLSLIDHPSAS